MRVVAAFSGSRGDVQPGVALAVELAARGHSVTMAVPPNLVDLARAAGVDTVPCGIDTAALLRSDTVTRDLRTASPLRRMRAVAAIARSGDRRALDDLLATVAGADVLVAGSVGQERALAVAEAHDLPHVPVHLCPLRRNRIAAVIAPPRGDLPAPLVAASWALVEQALWQTSRRDENRLRAAVGLPAAHRPTATRIAAHGIPEVQAYDPALFPGLADEWGPRRPLVGFLSVDATTADALGDSDADADLDAWIDAGPPPVYVGFGSMSVADPDRLRTAVLDGTVGHRVLVASGWGGAFTPADDDDRVRVVPSVDHASVLPRCVAAVHHGGAGTTAAALRAGIPAVACWLGADQPMWGRALRRAGVGVSLRLSSLTSELLRDALTRVCTPASRVRAGSLGEALIPPDVAVRRAADIVEAQ
ncbi:glycosyltransferase [uncultured Williamsia sp.]|uniref:glycosyltransferase n=1 Tax=uncultured Williamsia sp. TaxID=259311 RepID=UPI00260F94E3|nr:glycosyltransferase [uncultured Williamsia sp.]